VSTCQRDALFIGVVVRRSAPPPLGVFSAARLFLLLVEEAVLERRVRGTLVGRRALGTRPRCSGLPCGKHHDGPVAIDDDDAGEEGAIRALELDARRWPRHLAEPVDERLSAGRAARATTDFFEDDLADELRYEEGQIASEIAATSRPATAAAAPFFVASAVSTRMT
jgi:hypothetical protein